MKRVAWVCAAFLVGGAALCLPAYAGSYEDAARALEASLASDDYQAQVQAVEALVRTGDARAVDLIVGKVLAFPDQYVFERALAALRETSSEAQKAALAKAAGTAKAWETRAVLTRMLGRLGDTEGVDEAIEANLGHKRWEVQVAAIAAARDRANKRVIGAMVAQLAHEEGSGRVFDDLARAIGDLTGADLGERAADWAAWWETAQGSVRINDLSGEHDPTERVDVGTLAREPLYKVKSKRVLFILDVSGSMNTGTDLGTRLAIVKRELGNVFEAQLDDKARFNVMVYSDEVTLWKKGTVKASRSSRQKARKMVDKLKADGLTATHTALEKAFQIDDIDTIYLLSDGVPSKGAQTITDAITSDVRRWNRARGIVVHTIALLAGENPGDVQDKPGATEFMRALAEENGGTFKLVE
jgi:hypothetical protein